MFCVFCFLDHDALFFFRTLELHRLQSGRKPFGLKVSDSSNQKQFPKNAFSIDCFFFSKYITVKNPCASLEF